MPSVRKNIAETIDVGFFMNPKRLNEKHPGRISRESNGQLKAVMLMLDYNQPSVSVIDAGRGELWLFSAEKDHYVLFGVHGRQVGDMSSRSNLLGGIETFVSHTFSVEAVFRVDEGVLLGEKNPYPAICEDLKFDAFSLTSDCIALWVGVEGTGNGDWPPARPQRRKHPCYKHANGNLSIGVSAKSDSLGLSAHVQDVLDVEFDEPKSLQCMQRIAHIVHDFVNITVGKTVPMAVAAYSPRRRLDGRGLNRRFDLISQAPMFRPKDSDGAGSIDWPMLGLDEVGGLETLGKLLSWCSEDDTNRTILHRTINQWNGQDAFMEHWRTLTLIHGGQQAEKKRIAKLVDDVGRSVIKTILPDGVDVECWLKAVTDYRNKVVVHPSMDVTIDSRRIYQGPVFTKYMEFLLKAYIFKKGMGISLDKKWLLDGLSMYVNKWNHWDWRVTGKSHPVY